MTPRRAAASSSAPDNPGADDEPGARYRGPYRLNPLRGGPWADLAAELAAAPQKARIDRPVTAQVRHVELPGAGHLPFWDTPARLAALVLDPAG